LVAIDGSGALKERTVSISNGDPRAPPGTEGWAEFWRGELRNAVEHMFIEPGVVASSIVVGKKYGAWKLLKNEKGRPFANFNEFCKAPRPYGLAKEPRVVKRIIALAENTTLAEVEAMTTVPAKPHGGSRTKKQASDPKVDKVYGETSDYLAARIARDHPNVHAAMLRGEYQSVRAAAVDAGIVKKTDPVKAALRALSKVPKDRLQEFWQRAKQRGLCVKEGSRSSS
jgi:hypothetical protein